MQLASFRRIGATAAAGVAVFAHSVRAENLDYLSGVVQVEQTRSFTDLASLAATVRTAPPVTIDVPKGSSPSEVIKGMYGFGATDSKEAYSLLESKVLELNGASDPTQLPAGKVIVPDLPRLTSRPIPSISQMGPLVRNSSARTRIPVSPNFNLRIRPYTRPITISKPISESLVYSRIDKYPAEEAARIAAEAASVGAKLTVGLEAGIQLAGDSADCAEPSAEVLTDDERAAIEVGLAQIADRTERFVIVMDTGWPSAEEQLRSQSAFRKIFDAVRTAIRVPSSALSRFEGTTKPAKFVAPSHAHACMIWNSLREFSKLDSKRRVQTLYVPLRPGQPGARDFFRELIELNHLIVMLGGELFTRTPSNQEISEAASFAETALAQLTALREPWTAGDDVVGIYEPLVSGLLRIADTYTKINPIIAPGMEKVDSRFWLSLSWNFTKYAAAPALPSSRSYMVFAAAGNDGQDFVTSRRLFASEATMGWRVFAVMNSNRSGALTCRSAMYPVLWTEDESSNVASFPGQLGIGDVPCPGRGGGTSFSTPRLAWLTAASDAANRADDANWAKSLSHRILKSRMKISTDPHAAPVQVVRLFSK